MTRASLVIPSRGGRDRLPTLFAALANQTHADLEVLVVVDGDLDDTAGLVEQWRDRLPVRAVVFPENRGRARALNEGFAQATGEVLIRCDDDLEPGPHHVARHVEHHASAPAGVIGLCPNVLPRTPFARAYGQAQDRRFREEAFALPAGQRWRLWGANVSVTRATWEAIGGYDTAYRAYGFEDVDWGFRLHQAGFPILLDPALDAAHHGAATTTRRRAERAFHSGAARHTFERRHGTGHLAGGGAVPDSRWGRATVAAGRRMDLTDVRRLARVVDLAASVLPTPLARKAIAFTVESAAAAGLRHPSGLDHGI